MLLEVQNLEVSYGAIKALHGVSLSIARGEIVTLIGANGAGKTTLLRTISGLLRPTAGTIQWHAGPDALPFSAPVAVHGRGSGHDSHGAAANGVIDLHRLPPHEIVRVGISQAPEGRQIFPNLTVRENLLLGGYLRLRRVTAAHDPSHRGPDHDSESSPVAGTDATAPHRRDRNPDVERMYDLFPILAERRHQKAGTLSGGEQQMLAIARALMARPTLLLLDEPSLGLAPLIVRKIFQIIQSINAHGTTVFLVEQNARLALTIAHRGYVLQTGRVILSDVAANLLQNDEVKKAYLGG
ncbi:MAG: Branched-chain amino acid transport ATP-binding protein LivF [Phycisphaerales bacterium]|nr:Branched-chain amino acid transport ATP-binding protein LivF [Phycisphaerales bacterium]MDB5355990.1 Branched-chain amino acid transport ATP-binding protein LivF [Phycisphaerales bacterium]